MTSRYIKNKNCFLKELHWTTCGLRSHLFSPPELPQKMLFFGDLGFPSVILVNKSPKALCLSSKIVYQNLLYLLSLRTYWHLKYTRSNSFENSSGVISLSIAQRPSRRSSASHFHFETFISHFICNQTFQIQVPALPLILSALFVLLCM